MVMLATGVAVVVDAVTVREGLPIFPSEAALPVPVPGPSASSAPAPSTEATAGSEMCQTIVRPVRTLPFESFVVAVACVDWPSVTEDLPSETVTDATGTLAFAGAGPTVTGRV